MASSMDEPRPSYLSEPDPEHDRHRRRVALVVVLAMLSVLIVGVAFANTSYNRCKQPPTADGRTVTFQVPDGATGRDVIGNLADQGLIRCGGFVGNMMLRSAGDPNGILAGSYRIPVGSTLEQILTIVTTPPKQVSTVSLTVPEGLRIQTTYPGERSISSVVQQETGVSANVFAKAAESPTLSLPPYLPPGRGAEGFLFPDTYQLVKKNLAAKTIIHTMLDQFDKEAKSLDLVAGAKKLGYTPYQIVIIASMIEREAQLDNERPLVASVIYNRLAANNTLGIDATLLYDDPTPDGTLSTSDLQTDSPYNTRINAGLPPTPIASPGRASLEAALHPADTKYFYYVLCPPDGPGVQRFAVTYQEHLKNVQECLGG
jgi:peptidoglycan lytic transglycosylase G